MTTDSSANGRAGTATLPNVERQHCAVCNTDGEHSLEADTVKAGERPIYRCSNCGDRHERNTVIKKPPTDPAAARAAAASTGLPTAPPSAPNDAVTLVRERDGIARHNQALDKVEKPFHYNTSKIEPIDVIEAWGCGFHDGNALKYICRAPHKGTQIEDLKKARWYLQRLIRKLEDEQAQAALEAPQ